MPGRMEAEFRFGADGSGSARRREEGPTLRVIVLADLSGRAGREAEHPSPALAQRRPVPVDIDTFDAVLARMAPRLELDLGVQGTPVLPMTVRRLDDFHPDTLYRGLEVFTPLCDIRRRLLDPATFAGAAAEWARIAGLPDETRAVAPLPSSPVEDEEATRRRLLGRGSAEMSRVPPAVSTAQSRLDPLLREIVAPHVVPGADLRLPGLLRSVDESAAALLRRILHHPSVQALEAAWRSVHGLVTGLDADAGVELWLLDVTRAELVADTASDTPALDRVLGGPEPDENAGSIWPVFVVAFSFGAGADDARCLARLGVMAARAGGPVLAGADPSIVGCRSFSETPDSREWQAVDADAAERWRHLRESPAARSIGLVMPRILLRLPYGGRTDPVECFDFEELPPGRDHEAYLWGSPAFACARLIARSFIENGAEMEPGDHLEIGDLPAAVHEDEDGPRMKPCAEAALSDAAAERILDAGPMPLLASSRRNVVRLMRMQSIARPPRPLAGKWG